MNEPVHGGDPPPNTLDFSANLAPHGPPPVVRSLLARAALDPSRLRAYPSSREADAARNSLALAVGIDPDSIVLTRGGADAIDAALRSPAAREVAVPVPAFSEYERAVRATGKVFVPVPLGTDLALDVPGFLEAVGRTRAAIVNSPHNPSGAALERKDVAAVAAACEERGCDLVVDEAFVDYVPDRSIVREASRAEHVTVVRSLTKFYAIAGLRIGYAVLHPSRARALRAQLPSWPLGRLELEIVRALAGLGAYAQRTRSRNAIAREALATQLRALGIQVFPSHANFLLLELPVAARGLDDVLASLAHRHRIVVRDCRSYRGLEGRTAVRVAVLGARANRRLARALADVLP